MCAHFLLAPLARLLKQVLDQHLDVDVLIGEVPVHERLVLALLDDRLDQRAAELGQPVSVLGIGLPVGAGTGGVVVEPLGQQADQALDAALIVGHRQVQRRDRVAERVPAGGERLVEVAALMVDLGDHDGARGADRGALLPEHPGQAVDAVGGRDGEQGSVGRPQAGPQVAGEVGVARCVQQVDLDAAVQDRRQGEVDRALLPYLDLVEVADCGAILDAPGPLDPAGVHQQRLNQRRLARSGVADQHDIAHAVGLAGRGCSARGSRASCLIGHRRRLLLAPLVRPVRCLQTSLYLPATG